MARVVLDCDLGGVRSLSADVRHKNCLPAQGRAEPPEGTFDPRILDASCDMNVGKVTCCAGLLLASSVAAFCQSPPNDNFANRIVLSGSSVTFSGTLAGATLEAGEPTNSCSASVSGGSVWWTWTATDSTPVVLAIVGDYSACGSCNTWLQVSTGTNLSALTEIDCNRLDPPAGRYVKFAATAGATYQFRMFGAWGAAFSLRLTATNPPVLIIPPNNRTISPYGSGFFWTIAAGLPTPSYQWTFNGVPLTGQTASMLALEAATTNQAGTYTVIVSNSGGVTESAPVTLTVTDTNPVPRLGTVSLADPARLGFTLTGEAGRWYRIESSSNMTSFDSSMLVSYTNHTVSFTNATGSLSVPRFDPTRQFVRAALNVRTDVCIAHLKQWRAALNLYAIEYKSSRSGCFSSFQAIQAYFPGGEYTYCPEGGAYFLCADTNQSPDCTLHALRGHVINDNDPP